MSKEINWYAKANSSGHGLVIEEGTGRTVAVAYDQKDTALLAAAPAMLAELKQVLPLVDSHRRMALGEGDVSAMNIRAILAEVEG